MNIGFYVNRGIEKLQFDIQNYQKKNPIYKISIPSAKYPVYLRKNTSDIETFYQIFHHGSYNVNLNVTPKVIVDCGANIGLASVYFKNRYPNAKIIAVEPESSNFDLLKKNTAQYKDVECLQAGIWNKTTNLKITDKGHGNWGFITEEVEHEDNTTIRAMAIDELMKRYKIDTIDILKIDIESSEKELFEKNFEQWMPHVKTLIIEFHDHIKEGCTRSFFKAMVQYKFTMTNIGENYICELQ